VKTRFFFLMASVMALSLIIPASRPIPAQNPAGPVASAARISQIANSGDIPLYFIPNKGQADARAQYIARTPRYTLWLTREGLVFDRASRLVFLNADPGLSLEPAGQTDYRENYFIGDDPDGWRTDVPASRGVIYKGIYRNIDLHVHGLAREIEYDWIVRPGGDVDAIRLEYQGMKRSHLAGDGNLVLETDFGGLVHRRPVGYQEIDGRRRAVEVSFRRIKGNRYGFFAQGYDPSRALIIDPVVMTYSSFLGGTEIDGAGSVKVGADGSIYVMGATNSMNFPVMKPYDPTHNGDADIFITKFNESGSSLVYSTFVGGKKNDYARSLFVDAAGAVYLTGETASSNFPLKKAVDKTFRGFSEAFVVKLAPRGNALVYSTYLGGYTVEWGNQIVADAQGAAYVAGDTCSSDFPLKNALFDRLRIEDFFLAKFDPKGQLVFSTLLGGGSYENDSKMALDSSGYIYVAGQTYSDDYPVKNPYQSRKSTNGGWECAITKLTPSANALIYSTYLGGKLWEAITGIAVDGAKSACVIGVTNSRDFPVHKAYDPVFNRSGHFDGFVTKLSPKGNTLEFSTFLGGDADDRANDITVDSAGSFYIAGETQSADFPIKEGFDSVYGGKLDGVIVELNSKGRLVFSSFLGGNQDDFCRGIALDSSGKIYLCGRTFSANFPKKKAFDKTYNGNGDAFLTILEPSASKSGHPLSRS
jgi:hypothetical protein